MRGDLPRRFSIIQAVRVSEAMKTRLLLIVAALFIPTTAPPADADVVPDRSYNNRTPPILRFVIDRFGAALRNGDMEVSRALCDTRGWDTNLVGSSGSTLASFVEKSIRTRRLPRVVPGAWRRVGKAVIMTVDLVQADDGLAPDRVELVLVEVPGEYGRWLILGAGGDPAQVQALAERVRDNQRLAPPAITR